MAFSEVDLMDLCSFLKYEATQVVPYRDVVADIQEAGSIALRHDVDHSLEKAADFAAWEYENGFKSTYFILHSAPYWNDDNFAELVRQIVTMGHEIGLHNDALCEANGDVVLAAELIRKYKSVLENCIDEDYEVIGIADHGGSPYTNGDIWKHYTPESLGFMYEAYQLQRSANTLISDNQGRWRAPLKMAQTYMLVHPTWWPV